MLQFKHILVILVLVFGIGNTYAQQEYNGETINVKDEANKKQGKWIIFNKAGKKLKEGTYKDNKKQGLWKEYYPSGKIKAKITYKNNIANGEVTFYYENGKISEQGIWKVNKWVGKYKFFHENGNLSYDWEFNNAGKRTGEQKYYYPDGALRVKGSWDNGKKEGVVTEFYPDGSTKSEMQFDKGKINVSSMKEYAVAEKPNKKVMAPKLQQVKNSSKQNKNLGFFEGTGFYKTYNENKQIDREGDFVKGKLIDGKRYFYDENGEKIKTIIYKKGKISEVIDHTEE